MRVFASIIIAGALGTVASAQVPDFTPQTPLIGALLHNDVIAAERLLKRGADPNEGAFFGLPPLLLAVVRQNPELVRLMAARGANLDARDRTGATALMWAAFNESGDAAIVEYLLARGADPSAANKAGETALDWALRRGATPAVAALRKAGASNAASVKASVEKAIGLLQASSVQFNKVSGCYSCHHQSLPQMALGVARARGIAVDETAARQQVDATVRVLNSVYEKALDNRDRIPDPPISVSYALIGLAAEHYEADRITDAMTRVLGAWQSEEGAFHPLPAMRPPIESSSFAGTALSLRAMQLYGTQQDDRIERASRWLRDATPRTTEDRAMQLLGLAWTHVPADVIRRSADVLVAMQQQDGGWAQLSGLETDAYATGQALVALQTAGIAVSSPAYQRGVAYLLRTQHADGSWLVRSRTYPVQPYRESGFPHGKDQWISAAGTSWAAMALALTIEPSQIQ
jgi:N-acyl-D-amino-acid deacylase